MKNQNGKSPLAWIVTITIGLIIAGVAVFMIFAENDDVSKVIEQYKNSNTSTNTYVETKTDTKE